MGNVLNGLKYLYSKIGGDPSKIEEHDVSDYVYDIGDQLEEAISSGGSLPEVTQADIGKVLGVVSDGSTGAEYDLVTPSSPSGGPSIVKMHIYQDGSMFNQKYIENEAELYQSVTSLLLQGEAPIFQIFVDSITVYNSKPSSLTKLTFVMNGGSIEWDKDDPDYGQDAFKVRYTDDRCGFIWEGDSGYVGFEAYT